MVSLLLLSHNAMIEEIVHYEDERCSDILREFRYTYCDEIRVHNQNYDPQDKNYQRLRHDDDFRYKKTKNIIFTLYKEHLVTVMEN